MRSRLNIACMNELGQGDVMEAYRRLLSLDFLENRPELLEVRGEPCGQGQEAL
jgi:hypothetical protein